ncbi:histidine kinase [Desulfobacter hydrogenophilus]|uniref:Histidine kinase n=1 Tax=Desulfobacter hydrogenophilus TaxID=2291 RepID=A0A328F989_9BACT|nr:HD domain-containing phosphohydrolase [Desulfobacter hydrogenophilus]NDY72863.1 PAS domain S-box protein [Desulfobacter hydrogenophilus]QBH13605.1 PAS domain S-box protein [Desulfobacter hydrogenophilus]RAM01171.1 histidine kinase [Desulfobacter hydrogenophilus]
MLKNVIQNIFKTTSRRIAVPALLTIILYVIAMFILFLPHIEQSFISRKKEMIHELTETVWSLLDNYHERELSGELTRPEAQHRALLRIGNLRYGPEKKDYFWITDMAPRFILHPYRPNIVNKDLKDIRDPSIKSLYLKFNEMVAKKGAGFVDYQWQWKDDPNRISPKLSYIKGFQPWGWIVGTGMYLDDIYAEINAIRNNFMAISTAILGIALMLSIYSIRQSMKADNELMRTAIERKRLNESLKESKERFRSLLENTSDWIWESDEKGRYTYSSPRVEELLGFSSDETMHKTIMDFVPIDLKNLYQETFKNLLGSQKSFKGFETTCQKKNGQHVVVENNAVPVFSKNDGLLGYRGVTRDITDRKMAMEELKKSRDILHANLEETVKSLALAEEKRDPYTAGHQTRVDRLACAIARELGLSDHQIEGLHFAALLHDIGKIALPSEFLSKPTLLSHQEHEIIKCHSKVGYDILKNIHFPWPVAEIVYQHHEYLDGSGYPRNLTDKEILLEAKILTVADIVEAISSHRPYRPSLGMEAALEEIQNGRGIRYHAPSVDACLKLIKDEKMDIS